MSTPTTMESTVDERAQRQAEWETAIALASSRLAAARNVDGTDPADRDVFRDAYGTLVAELFTEHPEQVAGVLSNLAGMLAWSLTALDMVRAAVAEAHGESYESDPARALQVFAVHLATGEAHRE